MDCFEAVWLCILMEFVGRVVKVCSFRECRVARWNGWVWSSWKDWRDITENVYADMSRMNEKRGIDGFARMLKFGKWKRKCKGESEWKCKAEQGKDSWDLDCTIDCWCPWESYTLKQLIWRDYCSLESWRVETDQQVSKRAFWVAQTVCYGKTMTIDKSPDQTKGLNRRTVKIPRVYLIHEDVKELVRKRKIDCLHKTFLWKKSEKGILAQRPSRFTLAYGLEAVGPDHTTLRLYILDSSGYPALLPSIACWMLSTF